MPDWSRRYSMFSSERREVDPAEPDPGLRRDYKDPICVNVPFLIRGSGIL